MKNISTFLSVVVLTASSLNAQQVITSVANGNATSPFTWSCTCIPMDGDSISISHNVTLDVDYAYTMGGITINSGGNVTGNASNRILGVSGGYFVNNGTMTMGYVVHNGGTFTNNNNITALASVLVDQSATLVNNGFLIASDSSYINTNATVLNNNTFTGAVCLNAGTITNLNNFSAEYLLNTGDFTSNGSGNFNIGYDVYNTGSITLNTWSNVQGNTWNAENMTVGYFLMTQTIMNGDSINGTATFTNNGTVSASNSLYNSEDINGTGDFCVSDSTLNSGAITGTVDICDQTGGGWDLNAGTEAGTVTHCASGPCTIGIVEAATTTIGISPNPSNEIIRLQLSTAEVGVVEVIDITGRVVMREDISGKEMLLNVLQLPEGMYSVVILGETQNYSGRFVKE